MLEDILNFSRTVMFRGTLCILLNENKTEKQFVNFELPIKFVKW